MKLPNKNDPHGDFEGALPRSSVLDTLYRHKVDIKHLGDGSVELSTAEWIETHHFPELVGGLVIRALANNFGIPLVDFYTLAKRMAH